MDFLTLLKVALSLYLVNNKKGEKEIGQFLELSERKLLTPQNELSWGMKLFSKYLIPSIVEVASEDGGDDELLELCKKFKKKSPWEEMRDAVHGHPTDEDKTSIVIIVL